ncbi:MAG: sel1 repeat family protein [Verrucomicrobia bacterium]|nr:sel1 repeat family protein [Verrucomicrobiota bacterium]
MKISLIAALLCVAACSPAFPQSEHKESLEKQFQEHKDQADKGDAKAQYELGMCYYNGLGMRQDYVESVKWLRQAAEQGLAEAQQRLGMCYFYGKGVIQNDEQAEVWLHKAADQNNVAGLDDLGWLYFNPRIKRYEEAMKLWLKSANLGSFTAQCNLANVYLGGHGVEYNAEEGLKWFQKAAEQEVQAKYAQGHSYAQYRVGLCYEKGEGTKRDYAEAAKWYQKGAEAGNVGAQHCLALLFENGLGVSRNYDEAVKWHLKAAEQSYTRSHERMGYLYFKGFGVPKNVQKATEWYEKAAKGLVINQNGLNYVRQPEGWTRVEDMNKVGELPAAGLLGWILATSSDDKIRDGKRALYFSLKAVEATGRKRSDYLDILAAAYAEVGEFSKAVEVEKEALALAKIEEGYSKRLKSYESKSPHRETF